MDNILFSVVIPTYNSAENITGCLDSIAAQEFKNFEVLIMDGTSADDTANLAKNYKDRLRIKIFSEPDKGIYDAMNKGIAIAEGDYLYFLGSDDTLYNKNVLNAVAGEILKTDAKVLYGNVIMRKAGESDDEGLFHAGEFDLRRLFSDNICHQSIFYHKSVFKQIGNFNLKYPVFADYDFNLRCAAVYQFHYIDTIVANFALGGASTQQKDVLFEKEKLDNIVIYFFDKMHTNAFVDLRLYVKQAALSGQVHINWGKRLYLLLVYGKLKMQSLFA
ncbi:glycosyltransferase family 2 protein [Mucilaginibacter sp. L3T2-6]|uniref:glycosyltransferase family 2 protein n=1 Tax=Mucilaginibacter sp. L3T2-6 TaxID=3062491 RepID=UPI0026743D3A|nr:glycosyltransferase family 2 protein [Mucilaginibacter sp. L3T2-6]MDO3643053.1 glycosyltransferase family 2 protein [Mucilaginibacter sp. L3T2-6]MDV6215820.1 glycosyltransferase family 2 protein [Mucilaginibacter sp. L3T2-6]